MANQDSLRNGVHNEEVASTTTNSATVNTCDKIEVGSINVPIANMPPTAQSQPSEPLEIAERLVDKFNQALSGKQSVDLSELFLEDCHWRDHLCLSWDLRTYTGREQISQRLQQDHNLTKILVDNSTAYRAPQIAAIDAFGDVNGIQFFINASTQAGHGRGVVRLAESENSWKIFTLSTMLQGLEDYPEPLNEHRSLGAEHGGKPERKNWSEKREADADFTEASPDVLIIGGGQAGLTLAARLKMLNVPTLVIDTQKRVGDNWRRRYRHLVLHDPVWFDHLPYMNFPAYWPVYTPKDKLGDWFEAYTKLLELNVWTETQLTASYFDEKTQNWSVELERRTPDGQTHTRSFTSKHVVLATGHSGKANLPDIPGMDAFEGDRLCHSSKFPGVTSLAKGKKAIVVGSCNSAHDIAQNFSEQGYDVTMVQRSSTCVVSAHSLSEIGLKPLYSEEGPPIEDADVWFWSIPASVFKAQQIKVTAKQNKYDEATMQGLAKVGFKVDKGSQDTGLLFKYLQRGGGYYIDVGGCQLVIDGKIKIKQGHEIRRVTTHGLEFSDGSVLEADEIVFATGYQNMKTQASAIFSQKVVDKLENVWGFNEFGEMRTVWQKSGHPGFWFMGGNLALCRYYSRVLALQIKARLVGLVDS